MWPLSFNVERRPQSDVSCLAGVVRSSLSLYTLCQCTQLSHSFGTALSDTRVDTFCFISYTESAFTLKSVILALFCPFPACANTLATFPV